MAGNVTSEYAAAMPGQAYSVSALFALTLLLGIVIKRYISHSELDIFHERQLSPSRRDQYFAWFRATLRSVTDTHDRVAEGYKKFSKKDLAFLVPNIRKGPVLVLPPSQIRAVYNNPESRLSAHGPQLENIGASYTLHDPAIFPSNYEVEVFRKHITKKYHLIAADVQDEIERAFRDFWGESKEWKGVVTFMSLQKIAARIANRVIMGEPLCRNEDFLERVRRCTVNARVNGVKISALPSFLRRIFAPLVTWQERTDCEICIQACIPVVEERLKLYQRVKEDPSFEWKPPVDILQWIIEESHAVNDPTQLRPYRIAHRLVIMNFNTVHPISMTVALLLFDLIGGSGASENVAQLAKEATDVLASSPDGLWTKELVSKLSLADSAIRESMRMSDFGITAFPRRVSAPDGLELPNGLKVPRGVQIEVPMHSIHMDNDHYEDAAQFEPFRFVQDENLEGENSTGPKRKLAVTTEETFLAFGYGRNGCPGRYFAVHVMKVMLAHILMNYDIEFMEKTVPMGKLMEFRILDEGAELRIRHKRP